MLTLTRKNLWAHKRRLSSTVLAIVLGVAFLSGTLVLGDTMTRSFDDLFAAANAGTDAIVRSDTSIDMGGEETRPAIDQATAEQVAAVDGVAAVAPVVEGYGRLVGSDGDAVGGGGPPTLAGTWVTDPDLNPYRLAEGRAPEANDEVVINRKAALDGDLAVGDTATLLVPSPIEVSIVGISTFGDLDSSSGVTYTAFTLAGAQELVTQQADEVSSVLVRANEGVSQDELATRLSTALPDGTEAITGAALTEEQTSAISADFLGFLKTFLLVFACIALLVATFSIYNTFSIIVAQRSRESALLRALGASRRQVLTATIVEALAVGLVASIAGIVAGLGVAGALKSLFNALGFEVPANGLVVTGGTIVAGMVVGTVVTLVAGVMPGIRSSRIPPLAALREMALDHSASSRSRAVFGGIALAAGVALVLSGGALALAGLGAALLLVGVVALGPIVAGPVSRVIGAPLSVFRGMTGRLSRENAIRNPRRTSGTASALLVGVAVVTLFTVFAASIKASISESVDETFGGDLVITSGSFDGSGGFSPQLGRDVAALPEVAAATGLGEGGVEIDGDSEYIGLADVAQLDQVFDVKVAEGDLAGLRADQVAVSQTYAEDHGWQLGSTTEVKFPDGATERFTVGAIYEGDDLAGPILMDRAGWSPHVTQDYDFMVLADLRDGVSLDEGRVAVERLAEPFVGSEVQDRDQYLGSVASGVDQMLAIIYVLLVLAIIIALMGIANTLSLSVHERTRELGLLRAVGQTRSQVRSMVRWESVLIAVFGTLGGLGVGVFLGWAIVRAVGASDGLGTFAIPGGQLAIVVLVGAFAGILAAIRPARRAARLDILKAIATD